MLKKLAVIGLASLFCFGLAQNAVSPTHGSGDDQFDSGADSASVNQQVILNLPEAVALHLDVSVLEFDLSSLMAEEAELAAIGDSDLVNDGLRCFYGNGFAGIDADGGTGFHGQTQYLPLGTSYEIVAGTWPADGQNPQIKVINTAGAVTSYPPALFDDDNELIEGSKNYFVCYQTFILQKFSNHPAFTLTVSRAGDADFDIYVQDNTFCSFNTGSSGAPTGFYRLDKGMTLNLLPDAFTGDTTGNLAKCGEDTVATSSWLDDLVVVAVKVNGEQAGENTEVLTYTIESRVPAGL